MVIIIGFPVSIGIGLSYAYDYTKNGGELRSVFRPFNNSSSTGFLFSHLEALVTGVEVEKQSLTLVKIGKLFFSISFVQLFFLLQVRG